MSSINNDRSNSNEGSESEDSQLATFDATVCAQLHNEIVRRATALDPELSPLLIENAFEVHNTTIHHPNDPESPITDYLSGPVIDFLTQIVTLKHDQMPTQRIVPFFQPPDVRLLYGYGDEPEFEENPYMIWLYRSIDTANGGGIYFDQATGLAQSFNSHAHITPPAENWMRLEDILKKWLMMFDTGKIAYGHAFVPTEGPLGLTTKAWTDHDRFELLAAWETLISTIVSRMPNASMSSLPDNHARGIWSHEDLVRHRIPQGPLYDFLALAKKPPLVASPQGFRIAPATCLVHPSIADATFLPPRADARFYSQWLLPLATTCGSDSHNTSQPAYAGGFYLQPAAPEIPSAISYISPVNAPSGLSDLANAPSRSDKQNNIFTPVDSEGRYLPCPWSPYGFPSIADHFRLWNQLIVDGVWSVDANGVAGNYELLEATGRGSGRMNWNDLRG